MSAVVDSSGGVKVVRVTAPKIERLTIADLAGVANPDKLARIINAQTEAIAAIFPKLPEEYIDFLDLVVQTGGKTYQLHHGFGGRVNWWIVDFQINGAAAAPIIEKWPALTDNDNLGLWSDTDSIVTIRVAPVGA